MVRPRHAFGVDGKCHLSTKENTELCVLGGFLLHDSRRSKNFIYLLGIVNLIEIQRVV